MHAHFVEKENTLVFLLAGVHTCKISFTLGAGLGLVNRLQTCRRLTFAVAHSLHGHRRGGHITVRKSGGTSTMNEREVREHFRTLDGCRDSNK